MKLFGEKSSTEGIAEAVRKYRDINVREEDIGAVSTSICRSCYLLVKCIIEKTAKSYSVCHNADEKHFAPELERDLSQTEVPHKQLSLPTFYGFEMKTQMQTRTLWIPRYFKIDSSQSKG